MTIETATYSNLSDIQEALNQQRLTCVRLVEQYLKNIESSRDLNVFVEVYTEEALKRARELDARSDTNRGRLWGAVISLKDVISQEGHALTAGSKILGGYEALYSSTAVQRLLEEDAIIIGRVNCDEFAMGSDNRTSYYGPTRNGIGDNRVPGGSSGGSAVSVQMDHCLVSLGSDTGGSVRQPASFCGLMGFKPSYGRISRHGLIAYGSSFDQIGVLGKDLSDLKKVYEVIQGPDEFDGTLLQNGFVGVSSVAPYKFAFITEALENDGLQDDIKVAFEQKVIDLENAGHDIAAVSFELLDFVIPTYYVLSSAEASSNLSRYDGIRYGFRSNDSGSLDGMYTHTRTEGFGTEVKRRILLGTFVLSVGYYDAYFAKAQKVRRLIKEQFESWFEKYDAIIIPTAPTTAWRLGDEVSPVEMYLADVYSVLANLAGIPAISIPLGEDGEGLPFGIQILTRRFSEDLLFDISNSFSQNPG